MSNPVTQKIPARQDEVRLAVRSVLERVGDKWSVIVVCQLAGRTRRFNELRRLCHPINQRMLSTTLRALERDGLVTRTMHPTVPPRVEYALTTRGRSVLGLARGLAVWAEENHADIQRSRAAYDARTS
ncbi:helix-turn-helix transcriptional regulator [Amycolatopsis acidiphila]|uniref:winged helix-turn-helix transcriptional regulator n=1 Tax=Amycolatopsis acidiphila TaxID=715473 RepID=UPI001E3116E0|nr:helix-turn-helix domain-containing protein [Amycolatopsis acidiphila]UIJ61458.1 helix-turn-helix transcriptional regulator [Amycolatopsis acidiphila]